MDIQVLSIKRAHYERFKKGHILMVEETASGWRVHEWTVDGVAPQSDYETPEAALARAAQLLKITEAVAPQSWPETVCVGSVSVWAE
jgi:hypothetical protein